MQKLKILTIKIFNKSSLKVNFYLRKGSILKEVLSVLLCIRDYMQVHLGECNG